MELLCGRETAPPWFALLYGVPGIGKSTLATHAPDPAFMNIENGLRRIDCKRTPLIETLDQFFYWLKILYKDPCKTIVVDTLGALEQLMITSILTASKYKSISAIPYGKGGDELAAKWVEVIDAFAKCTCAGKNVLLIGHEQIETFKDPLTDDYDRYGLKINKKALNTVISRVDGVFFARWVAHLTEKETSDKLKAVGTGTRVIYTTDQPAAVAKNRFNLAPEEEWSPEFWSKLI
jgi:hypothetical protein